MPWSKDGNSLQYSCLESSINRGGWRATVHGVIKESDACKHFIYLAVSLGLSCSMQDLHCLLWDLSNCDRQAQQLRLIALVPLQHVESSRTKD